MATRLSEPFDLIPLNNDYDLDGICAGDGDYSVWTESEENEDKKMSGWGTIDGKIYLTNGEKVCTLEPIGR